ncbi:hypothetical protein HYQ46_012912 [Verticillium longisporum]|nr:hypothetical protein HYQ44_019222 [Verticillium longisporum]KAG7151315.1 hypothetical protein HYQ46_012912 [Verticillium longisporum]
MAAMLRDGLSQFYCREWMFARHNPGAYRQLRTFQGWRSGTCQWTEELCADAGQKSQPRARQSHWPSTSFTTEPVY